MPHKDAPTTRRQLTELLAGLEKQFELFAAEVWRVAQTGEHSEQEYFNIRFATKHTLPEYLDRIRDTANLQQALETDDVVHIVQTRAIELLDTQERLKDTQENTHAEDQSELS